MRVYRHAEGHDEFWPAYTDILMVTSLILVLLVVTFVISRTDDHVKREQESRKQTFMLAFQQVMAKEVKSGQVQLVSPEGERQVIAFNDQLLFDRGDARLSRPAGLASLGRVADLLAMHLKHKPLFRSIKVNGHTDEDPIVTPAFPSNWHLSSARATSVVYFLVKRGIAPERLSATGFAEFRPYDPKGKLLTDKASKRRIEIELLYPADWIAAQGQHR